MRHARRHFSLVELLVVVSIIAILMAILMPALGKARETGRSSACKNNQKQVYLAASSYADDYGGYLPPFLLFNTTQCQAWSKFLWESAYLSSPKNNPSSPLVCPSNLALAERNGQSIANCNYGTYGMSLMIGYYYYRGTYYYSGTGSLFKLLHRLPDTSQHFYIADKVFVDNHGDGNKYTIKTNLQEAWPLGGVPSGGVSYAHGKGANFLFLDGHVQGLTRGSVPAPPVWDAVSAPIFPW